MHSLLVGYSKATHFDPVWLRNSSRTNIQSETFQLHPFDLLYPEQRHVAAHATGTRASAHMAMGRKKKKAKCENQIRESRRGFNRLKSGSGRVSDFISIDLPFKPTSTSWSLL